MRMLIYCAMFVSSNKPGAYLYDLDQAVRGKARGAEGACWALLAAGWIMT